MAKKCRKLRHTLGYYIIRCFVMLIRVIPIGLGRIIFGGLGGLVYLFSSRDVNRLHFNVKNYYPEKSPQEVEQFSRQVYKNLSISFFDSIKLPWLSSKKYQTRAVLHNRAALDEAFSYGKGAVVLSGHVSGFELQTQTLAANHYPVFSVGANQFDPRVDTLFTKLRQRNGVGYIPRDGAARAIIRELKANKFFGVLVDQDATEDGVFAPFLGAMAFTPASPMRIAIKYDLPLLYAFMHKDEKGVYHLNVEGPIDLYRSDNPDEELVKNIAKFNEAYGKHILKYPEQWVWMHRRWKRKREDYPNIVATTDFPEEVIL